MFHVVEYFQHLLITNDKLLRLFKWTGNACVFGGAGAVALSITLSQQIWPFVFAVIGSFIWLMAAIAMRERALTWYQVFFIMVNSYAILLRA